MLKVLNNRYIIGDFKTLSAQLLMSESNSYVESVEKIDNLE
jgi:hypothetical protein